MTTKEYQALFDDFVRSNELDEDDRTWPDDKKTEWSELYRSANA